MGKKLKTIKPIAPEDLQPEMYIAVTRVTVEYGPSFCSDTTMLPDGFKPKEVSYLPYPGGVPLKVIEVCVPFVLVELPNRRCQTIDLRRVEIARVSKRYGKTSFERLKRAKEDASEVEAF